MRINPAKRTCCRTFGMYHALEKCDVHDVLYNSIRRGASRATIMST